MHAKAARSRSIINMISINLPNRASIALAFIFGICLALLSPLVMSVMPYDERGMEKVWSHASSPRWVASIMHSLTGTRVFSTLPQGRIGINERVHGEGVHPLATYAARRPDHVATSLPKWSRISTRPPNDGEDALLDAREILDIPAEIIEDARGWPFRSLMCRFVFDYDSKIWRQDSPIGGLPFSGNTSFGRRDVAGPKAIPTTPIAIGLALNTAFFAIVYVLVGISFRTAYTTYRRFRGHCPHCNYDLHGINSSRCPECGECIRTPNTMAD